MKKYELKYTGFNPIGVKGQTIRKIAKQNDIIKVGETDYNKLLKKKNGSDLIFEKVKAKKVETEKTE